jgi:hypothetical protein
MTYTGMILGAAAYMSPEQAKGRPLDKRADIWAFGCVLYEMVAGRRVFEGGDVSETLAAVIKDAPKYEGAACGHAPRLRRLHRRCLPHAVLRFGGQGASAIHSERFGERGGQISPDGRWVAFTSDESGANEMYVTTFPEPRLHVRVSTDGGRLARWRDDGTELFFETKNKVMAARITTTGATGASLHVGVVKELFALPDQGAFWMPASGGQRFLVGAQVSPGRTGTHSGRPQLAINAWSAPTGMSTCRVVRPWALASSAL